MGKLRAWMERHTILAFIAVAYGFSWGLWALMITFLGQINWLGSFGPSLAAIVVIGMTQGRTGLKNLLRPIMNGRFGLGWYLFLIPGAVLVLILGLWIYKLLGGVVLLPMDAVLGQLVLVPIYYLIVLIIGGPLGEEIGWRGFLLPHFLKQKNPLYASLLVFVLWFGWHLPLFWLPGASQQGASIGAFILFVAAWSVVFTWVYAGTKGSLLSALLLHTSINTVSLIMSEVDPVHADAPLLAMAVVTALVALALIVADKRMIRAPLANPA